MTSTELVCFVGAGGNQSPGKRDGGRGREAEGATERGGETDESQPSTRYVFILSESTSSVLLSYLLTIYFSASKLFIGMKKS